MLISYRLRNKEKFGNIKTEKSEICITSTVEYIGIYIDEELNFKYHITSIVAKISHGVGTVFYTRLKIVFQPRLFYVYITVLCIHI